MRNTGVVSCKMKCLDFVARAELAPWRQSLQNGEKKWVKKKASRHFLLLHPTDVVKELVTLHLTVWMFHSK